MVTCRRWPSSKSTETGTKALNMFTWFPYEQHSLKHLSCSDVTVAEIRCWWARSDLFGGMEANKSGEMKTVLTDRGGSLLWGITLATDGDLCPLFQFKQGQISSFYLVFLSLALLFVHVCVCVRERAHTCSMPLIYALLISINESHANYMPFIISFSFSSAQFKRHYSSESTKWSTTQNRRRGANEHLETSQRFDRTYRHNVRIFKDIICDISARFVLHIDLSCLSLLVSPGHGG